MKTYLKDLTLEEIIKRLKNGEVVHSDGSWIYKMIDGIICAFWCKECYIGAMIDLDVESESYFETEEPLTFEQGKFYKTREGKKAYISRITTTYIYGIITEKTVGEVWYLNGMHWNNKDPHKNDLISKWKD